MGYTDTIKNGSNWMYSSGPVNQLATWEPYLAKLENLGLMRGRYAFIHCVNQHHPDSLYETFPWSLWQAALLESAGRQMVVILDSHTEGPSWRHVRKTVERMVADGVDPRCVIQWTGGSHEPDSPIQTVTTMDAFSIITPIKDCLVQDAPSHHFAMLARVPRPHRVKAAVEILRRALEKYGYISCGSGNYPGIDDTHAFDERLTGEMRDRFPLLLPGSEISKQFTADENSNSVRMIESTGAFCNVIGETSHDIVVGQPFTCTAFMTEKSEKCFLLEQVPIWVAPPGQAALAREWGFDLFDDIIDHGYDGEPDPHRRIKMAIDQLARICEQPITRWLDYKLENLGRFDRNRERCVELRNTHNELQYRKLVQCMVRMPFPGRTGKRWSSTLASGARVERGENWVYSGGRHGEFHVWESYLGKLESEGLLRGRFVFVHYINYYHIHNIADMIPWDLWEQCMANLNGRQMVVILDSHKEGPSWRHVSVAVNRMITDGADPRCIIHWTGGGHEPDSPIQTVTTMDAFCLINPVRDVQAQDVPTHHFVMLARTPRPHRVLAAVEMLRRRLDVHGHISCGSGDYGTLKEHLFDEHVPADLRDRFPMMLPGFSEPTREFLPDELSDGLRLPTITGAFCNIVAESSHDLMSPMPCTPFMSEKSERPFLLGQVPIWVAAPGQAALAREWGFDLFDDIIDHGYDSEPDPHRRIKMAMDQLERLCATPMDAWRAYRVGNRERFDRNRQQCLRLRESFGRIQYDKLADLLLRMPGSAGDAHRIAIPQAGSLHATHAGAADNQEAIMSGPGTEIRRGDNWVYCGSTYNEIHVWEPYLRRLESDGLLRNRFVFVHYINYYDISEIAELTPWDLWTRCVAELDGRQMVVILDSHKEGPSWRHIRPVVERMVADGVDPRCIIHWTGGSHEPDSPIQTVTTMDAFCLITPIKDCLVQDAPSHHFAMLARVPRPHRVLAAVEMLQRGLDAHGYMSCGSGNYPGVTDTVVFDECVPPELRHRFPVLLPGGEVSGEFTVEENSISVRIPEVTGAFCSVVCETTHDLCAPNVCTAFATEKSEKAFLLEQVPIWIAAPGQVALIREWGFDLFDDIIDHGYDSEPDPHRRIKMAIRQLKRICSKPLRDWQRYKATNRRRFISNRSRCLELRATFREIQYGKLLDSISGMPSATGDT